MASTSMDNPVSSEAEAASDQRSPDAQSREAKSDGSPQDTSTHSGSPQSEGEKPSDPPLPNERPPPLPNEAPPDDGWEPVWDQSAGAYYFYNRFTGSTQWDNPRVPDSQAEPGPPGVSKHENQGAPGTGSPPPVRPHGGYNPAIHGDYDPTAPYALEAQAQENAQRVVEEAAATAQQQQAVADYTAAGTFNRFTGKWQATGIGPERHNDEKKSKRQMNAYFDVDAAANSHNGKSLKAERSAKKLSKQELKAFKEKRKEKKEQKRRAWLKD